jgi:hypothetical protein
LAAQHARDTQSFNAGRLDRRGGPNFDGGRRIDDRRRLEAIVSDRNAPQKHVWRAQIILASAPG